MEQFLQKVALWLEKIRSAPIIGSLVEDLITMTQLLSDCAKGIYEKLPRWTVFGILAALFYAFSPIDLILDFIPLAGYLDDAAVIGLVLNVTRNRSLSDAVSTPQTFYNPYRFSTRFKTRAY